MNFEEYSKKFVDMQNNYFKLDKVRAKLVEAKVLGSVIEEKKEEFSRLKKKFAELNKIVSTNVQGVKEYFLAFNEKLDYENFKSSLTFFNTFSVFEDIQLLNSNDYSKLKKEHLSQYKDEIKNILEEKKKQINDVDQNVQEDRSAYKDEFKKDPEKTDLPRKDREKVMSIRYEKVKKQKKNLKRQLDSINKEINMIEAALQK